MKTERIDLQDDDLCRRAYEVMRGSHEFERPWHEANSLEVTVIGWRHEDKDEPMELWGAFDGDALVGVATIWVPQADNTDKLFVEVDVDPPHRRRGAGSALAQRISHRAREEGRASAITESRVPPGASRAWPEHPYLRFAHQQGYALASSEAMRHLALPVADDLLDRLDAHARPAWEGDYRLETYVDGVPPALQEDYWRLDGLVAVDAPTGDVEFEPTVMTEERYREHLDVDARQGLHTLTTVAVHADSGRAVAYTDLRVPGGEGRTMVWQSGTLVDQEHRGHRLGLAVKVANLRRLQSDFPERRFVRTGNSDANSWMLAINEQLGFRLVEECPMLQLDVRAGSGV